MCSYLSENGRFIQYLRSQTQMVVSLLPYSLPGIADFIFLFFTQNNKINICYYYTQIRVYSITKH